jgi:phage gpG-like protein
MSEKEKFISIDIEGNDEARRYLRTMPKKIQGTLRKHAVLKQIGTQMVSSALKTINQGGRPIYKPIAQSTIDSRSRREKKKKPGQRKNPLGIVSNQPLIVLGTLRQSIDFEVASLDYLKYHQLQDNREPDTFPARPVWGVHLEDKEEITDIIIEDLKKRTPKNT